MDEKMLADILIALAGVLVGVMGNSFANGRKIGERLARLETKVSLLLSQAGLNPDV